jgi:glutaredoxin 3
MDEGPQIQNELQLMTGQVTVPSVFVNGRHLGGNDDTQRALRTGRLASELDLAHRHPRE